MRQSITLRAAMLGMLVAFCGCGGSEPRHGRTDAGEGDLDAFVPAGDAGSNGADAGSRADAGSAVDASAADAGVARRDAGSVVADDAGGRAAVDAGVSGVDAGSEADAGCTPGSVRGCALMCVSGSTADGITLCSAAGAWGECALPTEYCNGMDDNGNGTIDEGCPASDACIWMRVPCGTHLTLNQLCDKANHRVLRGGRRCPVAGGDTTTLDSTYGEFPGCCCGLADDCVAACVGEECSRCVVWQEVQCCTP